MDSGEGPVGVIGGVKDIAGMLFRQAACGSTGAGQLDFEFPAGGVRDVGSYSGVFDAKALKGAGIKILYQSRGVVVANGGRKRG